MFGQTRYFSKLTTTVLTHWRTKSRKNLDLSQGWTLVLKMNKTNPNLIVSSINGFNAGISSSRNLVSVTSFGNQDILKAEPKHSCTVRAPIKDVLNIQKFILALGLSHEKITSNFLSLRTSFSMFRAFSSFRVLEHYLRVLGVTLKIS